MHAQRRRGVHAVTVNDHCLGGGLAPKLGGRHKVELLVDKCRRQRPIRRRDPARPPATTATARRGALPGGRHCVVSRADAHVIGYFLVQGGGAQAGVMLAPVSGSTDGG